MLDAITGWFSGLNLDPYMEHLSNDSVISYFAHPLGIGFFVALMVFCYFMRWKIMFAALGAILAGTFLLQYVISDDIVGPDKMILLFVGGAVAVGAFVIYTTLMGEE